MARHKAQSKRSRNLQQSFFNSGTLRYGGDLLTKRKNRQSGRPLATRHSIHVVLRSTQAVGEWSLKRHKSKIRQILEKFSSRYGVKLNSMANVGNHPHLHVQLTNRHTYSPHIRAITVAIMMMVTRVSRWNKIEFKKKFWDRRPFYENSSRVSVDVNFKRLH